MNIQYISDSKGKTTGVFIPIAQWKKFRNRYREIKQEETDIPEWHKEIVKERVAKAKKEPKRLLDFGEAMDDIEKNL